MTNKKELRRVDSSEISENKKFLNTSLDSSILERKKVSAYLAQINKNIRILKNILNEVK